MAFILDLGDIYIDPIFDIFREYEYEIFWGSSAHTHTQLSPTLWPHGL